MSHRSSDGRTARKPARTLAGATAAALLTALAVLPGTPAAAAAPVGRPWVNPVLGEEAVYALTDGARGGVGIPGAFLVEAPSASDIVSYQYMFRTAAESQPAWVTIPAAPNTVIPFVPTVDGSVVLLVREVSADGLFSEIGMLPFRVAAPGQAESTPPPATLLDAEDADLTDGQTPVAVAFSRDLLWPYGEMVVSRGEQELGRLTYDGTTHRNDLDPAGRILEVDSTLLGPGLSDVTVVYRAFEGAPVATGAGVICADSCAFTGGAVEIVDAVSTGQLAAQVTGIAPEASAYRYQWYRDGAALPGQTARQYSIQLDDPGHELAVRATAVRPRFAESTLSAPRSLPASSPSPALDVVSSTWTSSAAGGATLGTVGQGIPLRPFEANLVRRDGDVVVTDDFAIDGSAHVADQGWLSATTGPIGETDAGVPLQAVRLGLREPIAERWDLYYRVHSQNFGWLGWAKNGEDAGTTGYGYRIEAIEIRVVPKGAPTPAGSGLSASYDKVTQARVSVAAHVQDLGWLAPVVGGAAAGTEGRSLRVEALRLGVAGDVLGGIEASAHVQNIGWMPHVATGGLVGTEGRGLRVEAFRIRLTGQMAEKYDVYYRTHAQNFGWLGWAKNGEDSGTAGYAYRLEAVQVLLVPTGSPAPSSTGSAYHQR